MNKFFPYPDTKHFKEATYGFNKKCQYDNEKHIANIHGTIKLHGTNFAVVYDIFKNSIYCQKRSGTLDKTSNFFGFQNVIFPCEQELKDLCGIFQSHNYVVLFGELIGEGVQKGIALSNLPKKFVIFDIALIDYSGEETKWQFLNHELVRQTFNSCFESKNIQDKIYCIENFKTWDLELNIHHTSSMMETQNIISQITLEVEKECPFGKAFGVSGIGEGVVWKDSKHNLKFKVKGEEHSTSKVKTLTGVSQEKIDALKDVEELAKAICTEARFKQGLQYILENPPEHKKEEKSLFIRWVVEDTLKEEIDVIIERGLDVGKVKAQLFKNAVSFWLMNSN